MDGQCQDEFSHCTDPGLEQERINVTFRWITRHIVSCTLRTGGVCCVPTCAQGSSAAVTGGVGGGTFSTLWVLLGVLCIWEVLALLVFPSCIQVTEVWTRPLGGGWQGHYLSDSRGDSWITLKGAYLFQLWCCDHGIVMLYMLAFVRQPRLIWYSGSKGHSGEIACKVYVRPLFLVFFVFLCSRNWGGMFVWHLWIGEARHPGPGAASFAVEVF